jgi:hypothetical protein
VRAVGEVKRPNWTQCLWIACDYIVEEHNNPLGGYLPSSLGSVAKSVDQRLLPFADRPQALQHIISTPVVIVEPGVSRVFQKADESTQKEVQSGLLVAARVEVRQRGLDSDGVLLQPCGVLACVQHV